MRLQRAALWAAALVAAFVGASTTSAAAVTAPPPPWQGPYSMGPVTVQLACPSLASCWSIDQSGETNTLLRWSSRGFTRVGLPVPAAPSGAKAGDGLWGITCRTSSDCWVVGSQNVVGLTWHRSDYFAAHWNGKSWRVTPVPIAAAAEVAPSQPGLTAVSCVASSNCWAVGNANGVSTFAHWNGRVWTSGQIPAAAVGTDPVNLTGLACNAGGCWAIGTSNGKTNINGFERFFAAHLQHGRWARIATPRLAAVSLPYARISCPAVNSCWLAGSAYEKLGAGSVVNAVLHWNGHRWSSFPVPSAAGLGLATIDGAVVRRGSQLSDISCASTSSCWAVGAYVHLTSRSVTTLPQVVHWDGRRWALVKGPAFPTPGGVGLLSGVSCSAAACRVSGYLPLANGGLFAGLSQRSGGHWRPPS